MIVLFLVLFGYALSAAVLLFVIFKMTDIPHMPPRKGTWGYQLHKTTCDICSSEEWDEQ